jgi:hypothetical protein
MCEHLSNLLRNAVQLSRAVWINELGESWENAPFEEEALIKVAFSDPFGNAPTFFDEIEHIGQTWKNYNSKESSCEKPNHAQHGPANLRRRLPIVAKKLSRRSLNLSPGDSAVA